MKISPKIFLVFAILAVSILAACASAQPTPTQTDYSKAQRPPVLHFSHTRLGLMMAYKNEITSKDYDASFKFCRNDAGGIDITTDSLQATNQGSSVEAPDNFHYTDPKGFTVTSEGNEPFHVSDVLVYDLTPLYVSKITTPHLFLQVSVYEGNPDLPFQNLEILANECITITPLL